MLSIAGLIAVVLLAIFALFVGAMVVGWIVLKVVLIGVTVVFAVVGGLLAYAIFQTDSAVIVGAVLGVVGGFVALGYESSRSEGQVSTKPRSRPAPAEPVNDRLEEMARSMDKKLRERQERYEARMALELKHVTAETPKPSDEGSTNGWLPGWMRRMLW